MAPLQIHAARLRRMAALARFLFFAALPSVPVIGYIKRDNLLVVILCFSALVTAGLILKSAPVLSMLLGSLVGFFIVQIADASRHRRVDDSGLSLVFFFAFLGLFVGIIIQIAKKSWNPEP
jgi:hypothetical protein